MTLRMFTQSALAALAFVALLAGCQKVGGGPLTEAAPAAPGLVGQENAEGNFLAYAHEATVRMPADDIAARVAAVRTACMSQSQGTCTVLGESQSAGQFPGGRLVLRAEPKAIEPLVAMAADGGELSQRSTQAEDLADAVRDNGLRQQRLRTQHARLGEFLTRPDIKAEDLIALSNQLSQIESELQAAEQESAQQQRRIRTNLLTLEFQSERVTASSSEIGLAIDEAVDVLDSSVATLLTILVASLPFLLFGSAVWWLWRWRKRRRLSKQG